MKIVLDTNVIIAASISAHLDHKLAYTWLDSCQNGTHLGVV